MRSAVAGKPRVHELAKELGVESKIVLAKLTEMGEYVKSASSTVEAPVARRLREVFVATPSAGAPAAPAGEPKVAAKPTPPRKAAAPKKAPTPAAPSPVTKPTSAHDIEVAAAEQRAAALKAEQAAAAQRAAQERGNGTVTPTGPAPRPAPVSATRPGVPAPPRPGGPAPGG